MKKLFIAFGTFQNAANVVPAGYEIEKGDHFYWIVSESIKKSELIQHADNVLHKIGISQFYYQDILDSEVSNIVQISKKFNDKICEIDLEQFSEIIILFGGGQKPSTLALYQIGAGLNQNYSNIITRMRYLEAKPIRYVEYNLRRQTMKQVAINSSNGWELSLDTLLALYGQNFKKSSNTEIQNKNINAAQHWKNFINSPELIDDWWKIQSIPKSEVDNKPLFEFQWLINYSSDFKNDFKKILHLHKGNDLIKYIKNRFELTADDFKKIKKYQNDHINPTSQLYRSFYNLISNYSDKDAIELYRQKINNDTIKLFQEWGWLNKFDLHPSGRSYITRELIKASYGIVFEEMVILRFKEYLKTRQKINNIISDIETQVHFYENDRMVAEHDIFVLLNNGIGLSLECKTFDFDTKDALARILALSRSSGSNSRLVVILPFFPNLPTPHFINAHKLAVKLKELHIPIIPFGEFNLKNTQYEINGEQFEYSTFEKSLDTLFNEYII